MQNIAVIGVGNFAAVAPTIAALAVYERRALRISLFDSNDERLDLIERFARVCLDELRSDHVLLATPRLEDALRQAEAAIYMLDEDAARRMRGTRLPDLAPINREGSPPSPDVPFTIFDLLRGDPNRPTPLDQLSRRAQSILEQPIDTHSSRNEVLSLAISRTIEFTPLNCGVLSLMRAAPLPNNFRHTYINWPAQLSPDEYAAMPHQILRWAVHSEPVYELLRSNGKSPIADWLNDVFDLES